MNLDLLTNLPSRDRILKSRWVRPVAHRLSDPLIWRLTRRTVARGAALGLLMAFLVPIGQTLAAAVLALSFRANLAVAAAATLVTNPLTFAPIYFAAYQLGNRLFGRIFAAVDDAGQVARWIVEIVALTLTGLMVFGMTAALIGYHGVMLVWRWRVSRRWRQRRKPTR